MKPIPLKEDDAPRRIAVVVNADAGTVLEMGADHFRHTICEAFARHGAVAEVRAVPGPEIRPQLREVLAGGYDLVVVSGGDGTLSKALPDLLDADVPVGVLSLGTLNLFGADIGLTGDIAADVAAMAGGAPRRVDIGLLNGVPFHSISGVGYSAMMARERERARRWIPFSRALSFLWAASRTLLFAKPLAVDIVIDGEHRISVADGVLVTNNRFDGMPWRRGSLSDGLLEVHTFQARGMFARLRTIVAVARGRWRQLDSLETFSTAEVTLRRRGRRRILVATDGEIRLVRGELHYTIRAGALSVVAPSEPKAV